MISGIVLAAGSAERMGRIKQILPFDGEPLLQHVVDRAGAAGLDEVVIVLGHAHERIQRAIRLPVGGRVVLNPGYRSGQASSLRVGLGALDPDSRAAVILLADEPGVRDEAVEYALRLYRDTGGPVVRTRYQGRPGHPVVLDRSIWSEVSAGEGDRGAGPFLARHPERVVHADLALSPPISVDTPEDYRKLTGTLPPDP